MKTTGGSQIDPTAFLESINLDEYTNIGTHCIATFVENDVATYFDSFRVEHLPKNIKKVIANKTRKANIYKIFMFE